MKQMQSAWHWRSIWLLVTFSEEQLQEGVVQLLRDARNAEALAWRNRYYCELLHSRLDPMGCIVPDETDEFFTLPSEE
jgi:hypothetical protein